MFRAMMDKGRTVMKDVKASVGGAVLVEQYKVGGRKPWSPGYGKFKNQLIIDSMKEGPTFSAFAANGPLPPEHGPHIDERCVEIPWSVAHIRRGKGRILDAGSVLNAPFILDHPSLVDREMVIWSLEVDQLTLRSNISYLHGDFRDPILKPETFETIVCISTLEHVGMWWIPKPPFAENLAKPQATKDLFAYRTALQTFRDLLKPGGQLLLTVPYGKTEDQDWLQIFGAEGIEDIKKSFGPACVAETYYRTSPQGWQVADPADCRELRYYNFVKQPEFDADMPAAARAVACLEFVKQG